MVDNDELYQRIFDLESENDELKAEIEHLEEEIENLIQDRDENYRPIPIGEQVGVSDYDFI